MQCSIIDSLYSLFIQSKYRYYSLQIIYLSIWMDDGFYIEKPNIYISDITIITEVDIHRYFIIFQKGEDLS